MRLFVALRPPSPVLEQLCAIMDGAENARWQDDDQLHLTLRFIGEVTPRTAEDVAAALSAIRSPALTLRLDGCGTFARQGRIDTLWAGVTPREHIAALARKVDQAVTRAGLPPEHRAYLPHVTLARFGRGGGTAAPFLARHAALASAPFVLDHFALIESRISHHGARYDELTRWPLAR